MKYYRVVRPKSSKNSTHCIYAIMEYDGRSYRVLYKMGIMGLQCYTHNVNRFKNLSDPNLGWNNYEWNEVTKQQVENLIFTEAL